MKKLQDGLAFYAYKISAMLMVLLISSPAFAGQAGGGGALSALGTNLKSILDDFVSLITGPLALGIGTVIILVALVGAWFQGGMESFKKALVAVCILGLIVAVPTAVNQIFSSMGALL